MDDSQSKVNREQQLTLDSALAQAPAVTAPALPPTSAITRPGPFKALKKVAWRGTAGYLWMRFIVDGLWDGAPVHSAEIIAAHHWTAYLSSIGFAPVNPAYMLPVFKLGWLLVITNLSLWEFIGFWVYVLFYPVTVLALLTIRDQIKELETPPSPAGLRRSQPRRVVLPLLIGLLVGWFLLYGSTTSARQVLIGAVVSGLIFLSLALRAFQRAKPLTEKDLALANSIERFGISGMSDTTRLKPATKSAAIFGLKVEKCYRWIFRSLALVLRGKRGKDRVAMYVLTEYVVFLILLASSAVLFWSLSIRLTATPIVSLTEALLLGASHFLPGIVISGAQPAVPLWAQLGPALTAWILFVLFVGPAASLLPLRQEVYVKRMAGSYRIFRKIAILFKHRIVVISALKDKLPPK